ILTVSLLIYSFFIGLARLLVSTTASTLLRERFGAEAADLLPYVYMGAAVAAPLTAFLYSKLEDRLSFSRFMMANLALLVSSLALFYILFLVVPTAHWLAIAFYIWYYVLSALITLAFWGLAGRLLNVRQSKRLFGLVGSGMVIATIISGFLVRPVVTTLGTASMLLIATFGVGVCLFLTFYLTNFYHMDDSSPKDRHRKKNKKSGLGQVFKDRYVLFMASLTLLALLGYYFVDLAFYHQAYQEFHDPAQLASFLAEFTAIVAIFTLASQTFVAGRVINRYGLLVSLLILPITIGAIAFSTAIIGTFFATVTIIFWLVVATRFLFRGLRDSLDKSSFAILYQALPNDQRLRAQTIIISIIEPVAGGLAGVILLVLSLDAVEIAYALLFILAGWIFIVRRVSREYKVVLKAGLSQRQLGDLSLSGVDDSSRKLLEQQLKNPNPSVAQYALNLLTEMQPDMLPRFLRKILAHPDPSVREDAIHRIEKRNMVSMLTVVRLRAHYETSTPVRAAALRTLARLGEVDAIDQVAPYLDDTNPHLRRGAMVGLLQGGGIEGVILAGQKLIELAESPKANDREFSAHVLGEVGQATFYRPLLKLLQDPNTEVHRAALIAAGKLKTPKLWPLAIDSLVHPEVRTTAISTLIAGGETVLPLLRRIFADREQSPRALIRVARICGQIQGSQAIALLERYIEFPENDVRHHILLALSRCGYRVPEEQVAQIKHSISTEIQNAVWLLAALVDIEEHEVVELIRDALSDELEQTSARIFLLLSFIHDPRVILQAQENLLHGTKDKRAFALEVLDTTIPSKDFKAKLFPLLEDNLTEAARLAQLKPSFPDLAVEVGRHRRLHDVLDQSAEWISSWGRACALQALAELMILHIAGKAAQEKTKETLISAISDPDPLMRETALWALFKADHIGYNSYFQDLKDDPSPQVFWVARRMAIANNGEVSMQSTIEKVIILKTVHIFAEIPEETLSTIAANLVEIEVDEGEPILEKGDVSRSMYIITKGQVRVHKGDETIEYLGEREIFGELATLDAEPQAASVTATEETSLFRLEQDVLYEMMSDHIEVARGVIEVLTRRLRGFIEKGVDPVQTSGKNIVVDGILDKLVEEEG
ncbi:MAG: Npt1/Npt2 family nucleotide transporter, partial [Chloroflexota bacterium]